MGIQGGQQPVGIPGPGSMHQHALGAGMDAGIGPAGALRHGRLRLESPQRVPERPLHAGQGGLDLPAVEAGADVGHAQEEGEGHAPV